MTDKEHIAKWLKGKLAELCNEIQCEVPELPKDVIKGKILAFREIFFYIKSLQEEPDLCIQYASREAGIKAHAENYSWNIESELFQQLTPEQQKLWRKEIEQACISGGYSGLNLARDRRYDDTPEMKNNAFIEKACEYLQINLWRVVNEESDFRQRFVTDFRNYMEGK